MKTLYIDEIPVMVTRKPVRNLRLNVDGSDGSIKLTAPKTVSEAGIRSFVGERRSWILKTRDKVLSRIIPHPVKFETGEILYVFGRPYNLTVKITKGKQKCEVMKCAEIVLRVRSGSTMEKRAKILNEWYRDQLKERIRGLIHHWEPVMGVKVKEFGVKQMKTRWGTCNPSAQRIWVNLELGKRDSKYLEYIVVHEMVHLMETSHNERFKALMDGYLKDWRTIRKELNNGIA